ncbi:hypothetical protein [Diaphorobacter caeni]|uniref:hypothetical protein n=1 Tax=Diaphorobacter caeni TaxID=2784387 RepID=UPI00188ED2A0|nr:hypothetical protein [Diaphorobacter caeni]MBF5006956.1 hypothetical protein [Diaphorobacter caeni]
MTKTVLSNSDYQALKLFEDLFFEWYVPKYPTTPNIKPSEFFDQLEKTSLAKAKIGVQMSVNDSIESTLAWSPEKVAEADAKLLNAGALSLSEVRRRYSKKLVQVLNRGKIRSETEYYLVRGIIDAQGVALNSKEVTMALQMLDEFEKNVAATRR